jgi:hypothetical protein
MTAVACSMFQGKAIRPLGFSRRGDFIGERASSEVGPAVGLHEASVKIGGSAFVSSNSKNISCVTFLKHKNSRKQELALWHFFNRLVPENA